MSKFTPGPWIALQNELNADSWIYDKSEKIKPIAHVLANEATAQLMASSPDMLETLLTVQDLTGHRFYDCEDILRRIDQLCRDVIVKATSKPE